MESKLDEIRQYLKEIDASLDYLATTNRNEMDFGHAWIAFTDKFNVLKKKIIQLIKPNNI